MFPTSEHVHQRLITAEKEITHLNAARFRARVELSAASSDRIIVDLRHSHLDSWGLLMLVDLNMRLKSRIAFVAPLYLRDSLLKLSPKEPPFVYSSLKEAELHS